MQCTTGALPRRCDKPTRTTYVKDAFSRQNNAVLGRIRTQREKAHWSGKQHRPPFRRGIASLSVRLSCPRDRPHEERTMFCPCAKTLCSLTSPSCSLNGVLCSCRDHQPRLTALHTPTSRRWGWGPELHFSAPHYERPALLRNPHLTRACPFGQLFASVRCTFPLLVLHI